MDGNEKRDWTWLPKQMPRVAQLISARRNEVGAVHLALCWAKGMSGEPGWFFAKEGPLAIGTPDQLCQGMYEDLMASAGPAAAGAAYLYTKEPAKCN